MTEDERQPGTDIMKSCITAHVEARPGASQTGAGGPVAGEAYLGVR